jgi:hypothetical protein
LELLELVELVGKKVDMYMTQFHVRGFLTDIHIQYGHLKLVIKSADNITCSTVRLRDEDLVVKAVVNDEIVTSNNQEYLQAVENKK